MKLNKLCLIMSIMLLSLSTLYGNENPVATMKSNSIVKYFKIPKDSETISGMFRDGMFYGRLRSNSFYFWWNKQDTINNDIHFMSGVGGSVVYKSARYSGFDFSTALYYSYGVFKNKDDMLNGWKAGKDVFSRHSVVNTGSKNMAVVGQLSLRYKPSNKSEIIIGRQLVESFYAKSNDTKMVPNTFDGVVITSKDIDSTSFQFGYLDKQKLRDHIESHAVLMVGDENSSTSKQPQWSENDDSAMHKGLSYSALKIAKKPTDAPLIVGDIKNKSIDNLNIASSFYIVPQLISQVMGEINYNIKFDGFSITPGIRYIKQFDNGAGIVGGASLSGKSVSQNYKNPNSLDSQMVAARVVSKFGNYKINLGYSYILDEADLLTPWRGFPTAGYTRSMGRYNWRANTKSYRVEFVRNTSDVGLYNDLYIQASILYEDDDNKANSLRVDTDSIYYYIGFMQNVSFLDNAQWRYRFGFQDFTGKDASQIDNIDTRFELNYFF